MITGLAGIGKDQSGDYLSCIQDLGTGCGWTHWVVKPYLCFSIWEQRMWIDTQGVIGNPCLLFSGDCRSRTP